MHRKIGALWSKKTNEGKEYLTGVISDLRGDIQITVCTNDKKTENQPDYDILLSEPKEGKYRRFCDCIGRQVEE
jgi:uncharacterized protein (DUF736 family)